MMKKRTGWVPALVILSVLATLVMASPSTARKRPKGCPTVGQLTDRGNGWTSIKSPSFPEGDQGTANPQGSLKSVAVVPTAPQRMYATNGHRVMRSLDGGCTWKDVFDVAELPTNSLYSNLSGQVTSITVPPAASAAQVVYLVVAPGLDIAIPQVTFLRSEDSGEHWSEMSGLPPVAQEAQIAVAPSDPNRVYVTVTQEVRRALLYVSDDGGATSSFASVIGGPTDPTREVGGVAATTRIAVDPLEPHELWGWDSRFVLHSTDGGASWSRVDEITELARPYNSDQFQQATGVETAPLFGGAESVTILHDEGSPATILVAPWGQPASYPPEYMTIESHDGGETWSSERAPGGAWRFAAGAPADRAVMATHLIRTGEVPRFWERSGTSWREIDPPFYPPPDRVDDMIETAKGFLFMRTADSIERYRLVH